MTISNGHFDIGSAKNIDGSKIDVDIRKIGCDFLRKNLEILNYCILVSEQKNAIAMGRTI